MDDLAELNFSQDLEEAKADPDAERWSLERGEGFEVLATLYPIKAPGETFVARLRWREYPGRMPASVVFVDPETGATGVASAWPVAAGFRPPNDICANWTAEGFVAHPEWLNCSTHRWDSSGNQILTQLRYLQLELDRSFQKRYAP